MVDVTMWQSRPLEPVYPVVFFDALRVKIHEDAVVRNEAIYPALGVLRTVTHSLAGAAVQAGLPLRMANTPLPPWGPAPLHGEHSLEVLQAELGLDEQTYAALAAAGLTGCGPVKGN